MKRLRLIQVLCTLALLGSVTVSNAQSKSGPGDTNPVQVGSVVLNLGVGAGADYGNVNYNSAFGTKIAMEVGLWQAGPGVITLGGEVGASFSNGGYYDHYKSHTIVVAGRSAWHYGWNLRGLDTYGGVSAGLGFRHRQYDDPNGPYSNNDVVPALGIFVGASYFITPQFGFNAEAGYDITNIQIGIVFKLM